jgi:uncharacterized protein YdcH (DUF465 family)/predicted  nucleic acid-binding Zn-ribbon protein
VFVLVLLALSNKQQGTVLHSTCLQHLKMSTATNQNGFTGVGSSWANMGTESSGTLSSDEICKLWDGKKVWAMIDDMWRQATVLACGPQPHPSKTWNFIVQSKHDSCRYVLTCNPIDGGNEFDNIEATEYIDIPSASISNIKLTYDSLPSNSQNVDLGTYKCPIHPYVAEYIKRLLFQLEMQSGDGHVKALVCADAENSRLRTALEASNKAYAAQNANYENYITDILAEIQTLNNHNHALAQAANGTAVASNFQGVLDALQAENRRLTSDNRQLRESVEQLKKSKPPTFEELEKLHADLTRAREENAAGVKNVGSPDGGSNNARFVALTEEINSLRKQNEALVGDVRLYGKHMTELSNRVLKYEGKVLELGRPAFDYSSSTDTTRMFTRIADEATKLDEKLSKLESSLRVNPRTGVNPFVPLQGSFAEQIEQLRRQLIDLQARVDAVSGIADRNSLAASRVRELEKDKNDLLKLLAVAEEERDATQNYLNGTVQPVMDENDYLRAQVNQMMDQMNNAAPTATASKGLFW